MLFCYSYLEKKLNGRASRDQLEEHRPNRKRKRNGSSVKATKVTIRLASGVTAVFSGPNLTSESVMNSAGDIQKDARRAVEQKFDIKTFEAVMRDKLKTGQ